MRGEKRSRFLMIAPARHNIPRYGTPGLCGNFFQAAALNFEKRLVGGQSDIVRSLRSRVPKARSLTASHRQRRHSAGGKLIEADTVQPLPLRGGHGYRILAADRLDPPGGRSVRRLPGGLLI